VTDAQQDATPKKRPRWVKAFLAVFAESGNVRLACEAAHIERSTAYRLRSSDVDFAAEWEQAQEQAADLLEQEARRRAHDGWDEPVFGSLGQGQGSGEIGTVRKYSDTLLIFLLKGVRPEKYRERADVKHSGHIDVSRLSDDELRAIVES
jgi:hypothetical protein